MGDEKLQFRATVTLIKRKIYYKVEPVETADVTVIKFRVSIKPRAIKKDSTKKDDDSSDTLTEESIIAEEASQIEGMTLIKGLDELDKPKGSKSCCGRMIIRFVVKYCLEKIPDPSTCPEDKVRKKGRKLKGTLKCSQFGKNDLDCQESDFIYTTGNDNAGKKRCAKCKTPDN